MKKGIILILLCLSFISSNAVAEDVKSFFENLENLTQLQKNEYLDSIKGKDIEIRDCGEITKVNEKYAMVSLTNSQYVFIYEVPKKIAITYNIGEKLCFSGKLLAIDDGYLPSLDIEYRPSKEIKKVVEKPLEKIEKPKEEISISKDNREL